MEQYGQIIGYTAIAVYFIFCLFDFMGKLVEVIFKTPANALQPKVEQKPQVNEAQNVAQDYLLYVDSKGFLIYENRRIKASLRGADEFNSKNRGKVIGFTADPKKLYAKGERKK